VISNQVSDRVSVPNEHVGFTNRPGCITVHQDRSNQAGKGKRH
jgi:hypothetical protein